MTRAHAVIGAGYGDEGKGLATDALCASLGEGVLVVRTNGGAQAGHTVVTPQGLRHVFHHVGAGALARARTHLSRFFVANPILFLPERETLAAAGAETRVSIDPRAPVTTPYDMMINQIVEEARGSGRHGSCGLGFGESLERDAQPGLFLRAADLFDEERLTVRLVRIRDTWVARRLAALGVTHVPEIYREALESDGVVARFLEDCRAFREHVALRADSDLAREDAIVFEGAQGLMLDQDLGAFPHVTRSHTGLPNMVAVAREAGIGAIEATYVTRAYATRHGAGPFAHEAPQAEGFAVVDETNRPNAWQGSLRFGVLDLDALGHIVRADLDRVAGAGVAIGHGLLVTCLDQAIADVPFVETGMVRRGEGRTLALALARRIAADRLDLSWGPTRATLERAEPSSRRAA